MQNIARDPLSTPSPERMPLAEACRLAQGVYHRLWRGVTSGALPAEKRFGRWEVLLDDVLAFMQRARVDRRRRGRVA